MRAVAWSSDAKVLLVGSVVMGVVTGPAGGVKRHWIRVCTYLRVFFI